MRGSQMKILLALLLLAFASITILDRGHASTDQIPEDPEAAVDRLMADFSGDETPGVVVGVIEDGELVFQKAYGMANLTDGIPFQTDTRSNIGSVTKQFTAMGILLLEAEGKLSLQDDLRKHLPELKDFGTPITIKNLLNHTGGYRELYNLLPMTGYQGEDALSRQMAIQVVQRQPELQSKPNSEFNYNNTGYILLATTIERVTGMTFPEYMRTHVFEPLGMMDTRVKAGQGEIIPHSAYGYALLPDGGFRQTRDLAAGYGAGGIYTTVGDLAKWMMNYRDAKVGGAEAIAAMTTSAVLNNGASTGYGLGLGLSMFGGRELYTHTGGDIAHRAYFGYYPALESGVVIMSNNASFNLAVGPAIAVLFFGDRMGPVATVEADKPVESVFETLPASATFLFEADGRLERAATQQGASIPVVGVGKVPLDAGQPGEFLGRYYSEELETAYDIRLEEGKLRAHSFRLAPITLACTAGDQCSGSAFFFASMDFWRSEEGEITGFMASNGRTRDVWFGRLIRRRD